LLKDDLTGKITLKDVILELTGECADKLSKLEFTDTKHALAEAKRVLSNAELKIKALRLRIVEEITPEVIIAVKKNKRVYGDPQALIRYNEEKKKNQ